MKITAAQHVSGMLTSRQSPKGQAGYQTLYYTREMLTAHEVSVIERRVQYASARDGKAKWQSYRLSALRHVISRIVPIFEPDEFGRRGRYFTHSLVCDVRNEQQFQTTLGDLLRAQNFFPSLDKVLAADGMKSGHIPAATLEAGNGSSGKDWSCLRGWRGEQLNRLYMLTQDPRQLTKQGEHVAFVGSEEQILEALKVALLLTPSGARESCSFDTNAPGTDAPSDFTFWGRGSELAGSASYVIDAANREVRIPQSSRVRANGFSFDEVSAPLRHIVNEQLDQPTTDMLRHLAEHKYATFVGEVMYRTLLRETGLSLTEADLKLLSPLGETHNGLRLLLALKSGNDAQRLKTLAAIDGRPSYEEQVRQLRVRHDFRPWQVFSPVFMRSWFDLFRGTYGMDDLTTAITRVAEHGSRQDQKYIESLHEYLDPARRQELSTWLKASKLHLKRLQAAMDKSVKARASRKPRSFLRRILHPFGK